MFSFFHVCSFLFIYCFFKFFLLLLIYVHFLSFLFFFRLKKTIANPDHLHFDTLFSFAETRIFLDMTRAHEHFHALFSHPAIPWMPSTWIFVSRWPAYFCWPAALIAVHFVWIMSPWAPMTSIVFRWIETTNQSIIIGSPLVIWHSREKTSHF